MTNKEKKSLTRTGRYLAMLLRHRPDVENLTMDSKGFVPVKEILNALDLTKTQLEWIVENNNKKRFAFGPPHNTKIRAVQGHSFDVELDLEESEPPEFLYHGTSSLNAQKIMKLGLHKMERQHVHLSIDEESARNVGQRKVHTPGVTVHILKIDSKRAYEDGQVFYHSENGYWLTDDLDVKYVSIDKFY